MNLIMVFINHNFAIKIITFMFQFSLNLLQFKLKKIHLFSNSPPPFADMSATFFFIDAFPNLGGDMTTSPFKPTKNRWQNY